MLPDLNKYIGIPYGYREKEGLDCYQFTRLVLQEVFGVEAPDYEFKGPVEDSWIAFAANQLQWLKGDGSPGDVALFRIGRYQHCGVVMGDNQMLHTLRGHHSALEDYTTLKWRDRLTGFYKWPK